MMKLAEKGVTNFVGMVVRDGEIMLDFYLNILGLEFDFTDDSDKKFLKHYLKFKGGRLKLFVPNKQPEYGARDMKTTGYLVNTFKVTNMTELFEKLTEKDVKIITPMKSNENGLKWGIISDPEGNLIEIAGSG